jgi:hypothetical protein
MNPFKAIGRFFASIWRIIWRRHGSEILAWMRKAAVEITEAITHMDLNGDGRVPAIEEILRVAQIEGVTWGWRFAGAAGRALLDMLPGPDLAKWLAVARVTLGIVEQWGIKSVPRLRVIAAAIETALVLAMEDD